MKTSDKGIAFLVAHEGVVPGPYRDSVGVWTYGVGHTAAAGAPVPEKMKRGMPADLDAALADAFSVFRRDLVKYEADVNRALSVRSVPQHQFDAAVSFHFNTGAIERANWVNIWRNGRVSQAAQNMVANWRTPAEIIERRRAEADLLASGDYGTKKAAVWPVGANGQISWKPVRTLSQQQILAFMSSPALPDVPGAVTKPPAAPVGFFAWLARLFGAW
ncbi:lysozyme [Paracoccus phage vB_PmaP_KLEP18-1]|nr:lysozyme [Paracoccus phage vB_PmaP_KLEP18-1]